VGVLSDGSVAGRSLQLPRGKRLTTICDEELLGSFVKSPWVCAASLAVFSVAVAGSSLSRESMPWSVCVSMAKAQLTSISGLTTDVRQSVTELC
jgi:hypothetical protein